MILITHVGIDILYNILSYCMSMKPTLTMKKKKILLIGSGIIKYVCKITTTDKIILMGLLNFF